MGISGQVDALKTILATGMPPALVTAGLPALDEYVMGGPTDSGRKSLGVYMGPWDESPDRQGFRPVIQLALPGVSYPDGLKVLEVLIGQLKIVDPSALDCTNLENISCTEFPPDEDSATIFTLYLEYSAERDDCDGWR